MEFNTAVNSTKSFIYGTSTLLGQEECIQYLRLIEEYVKERINKEQEGTRRLEARTTKRSNRLYRKFERES